MFRISILASALAALTLCGTNATAQCTSLGPMCQLATTLGPRQQCRLPPSICSPLTVLWPLEVRGGAPNAPALLVLSDGAFPGPPIPVPRPPACDVGCAIQYLPLATLSRTTDGSGTARVDVVLPCIPQAVGRSTYSWWAIFDSRRGCAQFSDVMQVTWQ